MKNIKLLIPKGHILEIGKIRFKPNKLLRDSPKAYQAAKYALYKCFLARHIIKEDHDKEEGNEWAPLWSQLMGSIAGNNKQWALVKAMLVNAGYLECDNVCKHGSKSYCFRLGPVLQDTEWDYSPDAFSMPEDPRPKMEWLEIDKGKAHLIIDEIAIERSWDSRVIKGWHTRVDNFSSHYQTCKTGRAYSDANQFPKRVRDTLLIDGEPTAEIDIVNCQPLLLATIYPTRSDEWKRYKDLAENGRVYEALAKSANMSRTKAKKEIIPFIFGGNSPIAEKFFRESFPELLDAILERRRRGHKTLAHELQNKESAIIVERVCKQFKAASIHDGVRVKISDAEEVKAFVETTIFEMWGLHPKITMEAGDTTAESKAA